MKFRRNRHYEAPEINFIPLIDVLLVILIFLMVTTTYSRYSQLNIKLPTESTRSSQNDQDMPKPVSIAISKQGELMVGDQSIPNFDMNALSKALNEAAQGKDKTKIVIIINADANTTHQNVIKVMETARNVGYTQITFATQHQE